MIVQVSHETILIFVFHSDVCPYPYEPFWNFWNFFWGKKNYAFKKRRFYTFHSFSDIFVQRVSIYLPLWQKIVIFGPERKIVTKQFFLFLSQIAPSSFFFVDDSWKKAIKETIGKTSLDRTRMTRKKRFMPKKRMQKKRNFFLFSCIHQQVETYSLKCFLRIG